MVESTCVYGVSHQSSAACFSNIFFFSCLVLAVCLVFCTESLVDYGHSVLFTLCMCDLVVFCVIRVDTLCSCFVFSDGSITDLYPFYLHDALPIISPRSYYYAAIFCLL